MRRRAVARQPRGERRRTEVLEAALRLLARDGPRAVTHRAVAAEAGCSLRATTYYFQSRQDLVAQAFRLYAERAVERFARIAAPVARDPATLSIESAASMLADTVLSDVVHDRDGLVAEFELVLEIARRPALEGAYREWQGVLETMLAAHARALGSRRPVAHARIVLATLRGLELEALSRPGSKPRRAALREVFRTLLAAMQPSRDE